MQQLLLLVWVAASVPLYWVAALVSLTQPDQHTSSHTIQNHIKMKMNALKPLGEEKPAVINDTDTNTDTKIRDTLVDVPLPAAPWLVHEHRQERERRRPRGGRGARLPPQFLLAPSTLRTIPQFLLESVNHTYIEPLREDCRVTPSAPRLTKNIA